MLLILASAGQQTTKPPIMAQPSLSAQPSSPSLNATQQTTSLNAKVG